jgi:hypothetical protein
MLLFLEAHIIICAGKTWQGNNFVGETPLSAGKLSHFCCFNSPLRVAVFWVSGESPNLPLQAPRA